MSRFRIVKSSDMMIELNFEIPYMNIPNVLGTARSGEPATEGESCESVSQHYQRICCANFVKRPVSIVIEQALPLFGPRKAIMLFVSQKGAGKYLSGI